MKESQDTTRTRLRLGRLAVESPLEWMRWLPAVSLALLALAVLLISGRVVFLPFLASVALAYLLAPFVNWFERRGWSRSAAVLLVLTLTGLLAVLALIVILPSIWAQLNNSYEKALDLIAHPQKAAPLIERVKQFLPAVYAGYLNTLWERAATLLSRGNPGELFFDWLQGGWFQLVNFTASLFDLLLVPFFVYYLLADYRVMQARFAVLIPPRWRPQCLGLISQINLVLSSYVRGQLLIALLMSALYVVGFLCLRVPIAITLGVLSGLLNFIPYLGTLTGITLALIFLVLDGAGLPQLFGVLAVFAIVQSLEGYFFTPQLLGDRLNLSPLWVLVGLLVGGNVFGLLGIVLALPVLAVAKVLLEFLEGLYQQSEFYNRTTSPLVIAAGTASELQSSFVQRTKVETPTEPFEHQPRLIVTSSELASRQAKVND